MSRRRGLARGFARALAFAILGTTASGWTAEEVRPSPLSSPLSGFLAGTAARDISPTEPMWLSGYAARTRPSEGIDLPLLARAFALASPSGERLVICAIDNCELSPAFAARTHRTIEETLGLAEGAFIVVPSHTHSAPVLQDTFESWFPLDEVHRSRIERYSTELRKSLEEVARAALAALEPADLSFGMGRAGFGMNRRSFSEDQVGWGGNPDGPTDPEVPVLRVASKEGEVRAILFGYACHATSISGDDFYKVSPDFPGYAAAHIESVYPGARALFLTGYGADINPSPRGSIRLSRRHGLELAGAVVGVLSRPMRPIEGTLRRAFRRIELPLGPQPTRESLLAESAGPDPYAARRARDRLALLDGGKPAPSSVSCPMSVLRLGDGPTLLVLSGEVVVDYALRLKREFAGETPWCVGYAYEVPCYVPSARILREGGYEADSSLVYYGVYGPLLPSVEGLISRTFHEMARESKSPGP